MVMLNVAVLPERVAVDGTEATVGSDDESTTVAAPGRSKETVAVAVLLPGIVSGATTIAVGRGGRTETARVADPPPDVLCDTTKFPDDVV